MKNRSSKVLVLAIAFSLLTVSLLAQTALPTDNSLQEIIENNAAQTETESFDFDGYVDELENFRKRPLDLNKASVNDLNDLTFLTPQQINSLVNHRAIFSKFISIFELQAVPNFDLGTIYRMLPFVKVGNTLTEEHFTAKELFAKGRVNFISRYRQIIEKSNGYTRSDGKGYLGRPFNLYVRFRYNYGTKFSYGFTAEKDAGEEFFKNSNKQGFDFYSGHIFLRNFKVLKALALGDYELRLGQGLIFWSRFGYRKSPAVMNVKREGMKLRPYTSVNEANYLRGAAFTLGAKGFEVTAFGSYRQADANIISNSDTSLNADEAFSSFNESGYHRTANEIADKNSVTTITTGGNFSYNRRTWHVGINTVYNKFFKSLKRTLYPYNQFDFNRSQLINASIDYHLLIKNFHFFGEAALSDNLGFGILNGAMISADSKVDISIVHRYYSRDFHSLNAIAFAEASKPQNENGIYLGISIKPISMVRIDGFFDLYKSNWLKYLTDAPSFGNENFLQLTVTPNKKFEAYARYRFELKKKNQTANEGYFDYLVNEVRQGGRINFKYKVSDLFTLSNRVEVSFYKMGTLPLESGFLIYQDLAFKKLGFPLSFNARLGIFKTSSYNTRIYAYENDVLYSFSIPAHYGNGMRYYLTLNYDITRNIEVWFRIARTDYFDSKTIGSGLDAIEKNHKTELKAQLRLKF
jgi:hypothetical protein